MKKLYALVLLAGTFLVCFAGAHMPDPWNVTITSTTWTAVTASRAVVEFQVKTRSPYAFRISSTNTGDKYYTSATGEVIQFNMPAAKDTLLFYIQATAESDTLEILLLNK